MNKLGSLDVRNAKGDIRIFVPEHAGFTLNAQARDGEIQTDFNQLKVNNGDDRATATGTVNGGGPRIVLENEHGTIEISRGTPIPPPPPQTKPPSPPAVPQPTEN
jgi:hypothetical protein